MNLDADITQEELKVFLEEANEQIELMDEDIVRLEKERDNPDLLQEIFRAAHTIKGSSAMVGYQQMAELTHAMESLLDKLRNKELEVTTGIIDALLFGLDILKILKEQITSSDDSPVDIEQALSKLRETLDDSIKQEHDTGNILSIDDAALDSLQEVINRGEIAYRIKVSFNKQSEWIAVRCLQVLNELERTGRVISSAPSPNDIDDDNVGSNLEAVIASSETAEEIQRIISTIEEIESIEVDVFSIEEIDGGNGRPDGSEPPATEAGNKHDVKTELSGHESQQNLQSVRVDVQVLDSLMNIVEELVIDRSKISQVGKLLGLKYTGDELIHELGQTSDHIIKIISELQENIMQVRMIPIGTIFNRFPRMVRDLAQTQKKEINFIVEGGETELDRSIIERIRDPLIHLLRNAVDHGVELPEERVSANKTGTATIRLKASREQSHIVITVEDDGKGINARKVIDSALKKELLSTQKAEYMTESDAINLIFLPGMSTKENPTEVSGRGVGMDIIKTNVEHLGGSISIDTVVGKGSKFTIKLPLTVAIIQGFPILVSGAVYILPLDSIAETMAIETEEIQTVGGREIIRWRDTLIPLVRSYIALRGETTEAEKDSGKIIVVVLKADDCMLGLIIDELMEPQEVVVKSLGNYLGDIEGIAGATILGDGRVALILDISSLANLAAKIEMENSGDKSQVITRLSVAAA